MLFMMFYVCLMRYWYNGPMWPVENDLGKTCGDYWWRNLLYINNFFKASEAVRIRSFKNIKDKFSSRPRQAKKCVQPRAKRAFQIILRMRRVSSVILLADTEDPDQTARMRRLIWAFAVHICLKTGFCMARPK